MTAVATRQADQATKTSLPLTRLAKLWAAGTGSALLGVTSAYLVAEELADPLVVAGVGEVTLNDVTGFTIFGATVGAALAVATGRFSRRPRLTFLAVSLIALAGYAVVPFHGSWVVRYRALVESLPSGRGRSRDRDARPLAAWGSELG